MTRRKTIFIVCAVCGASACAPDAPPEAQQHVPVLCPACMAAQQQARAAGVRWEPKRKVTMQ